MKNDDLEFLISQYIDGGLAAADRASLEARLAQDPAARATLEEYRELNLALKSLPLPNVRWNALAASISSAVDSLEEGRAARYRLPGWIRSAFMPMALAASVMIAASVSITLVRGHFDSGSHQSSSVAVAPVRHPSKESFEVGSVVTVNGLPIRPSGPVVEQVVITASANIGTNETPIAVGGSDEPAEQSHVSVASGLNPAHDTASMLSFDME